MKKILLALLVLTIAVPAMGQVKVTISRDGTEANKVYIGYNCTAGELVRAFAINVNVNRKGYVPGSAIRVSNDYYVTPTNIQFATTSVGGVTYISSLGSPVVSPSIYPNDANGFILEMASLYAPGDPNHLTPPPASGNLVKFGLDCTKISGNFNTVDVSIATNAARGGIVLEDGNSVSVILSPSTYVPPKLSFCRSTIPYYLCPGQPSGDGNGDGSVGVADYALFKKAYGTNSTSYPHGTALGQYNCACDFNHDGSVGVADYAVFKSNYGRTGMGACTTKTCP